ncbi:MAG: hypothetical protein A3I78_08175 [Gammaproteobacteria bacterium RIFCSPLOWO2_02_FULL_56_15]|nr:MAG: hypothetical protein A3I78_08175 [Gammaproteobacteria bacterium RIFCSPLOWO2_02_FULL_56_15]
MCDIWRDKTGREMPLELVEDWLEQLHALHTREIVLSGGEPLMHSEVEKICAAARSCGFRLTLLTTGLLLKRHAPWISRGIDRIYVSLDGPAAVHNRIRNIPGAYAKLAAGISAVRSLAPNLPIGARCTIQQGNFRNLNETVAAARQLGLDSISFLAADILPGHFSRPDPWTQNGIALSSTDLPALRSVLDRLYAEKAREFADGFIVESPEKLEHKLYQYFQALAGTGDYPAVHCNAPWVSTVIETDGRLRPCFFHRPYPGHPVEQPLEQIINSAPAKDWRQSLDMLRDPICKRCVCTLARSE